MEEFLLNNESLHKIQGGAGAMTGGQLINGGNTWCTSDYGDTNNQQIMNYHNCCDLDASGNCK